MGFRKMNWYARVVLWVVSTISIVIVVLIATFAVKMMISII